MSSSLNRTTDPLFLYEIPFDFFIPPRALDRFQYVVFQHIDLFHRDIRKSRFNKENIFGTISIDMDGKSVRTNTINGLSSMGFHIDKIQDTVLGKNRANIAFVVFHIGTNNGNIAVFVPRISYQPRD